jgi:hypothetical protein
MRKIFTFLFVLLSLTSFSQSTTVVISQAYSGGGTGTGPVTYKNDYVELHNVSTVTQNIGGFSLQYGSAAGNFGASATQIYTFPAATTIPAGGYLLIQLGTAGTAGADLPVTPDLIGANPSMGATAGKVALVNNATALLCGATATLCSLPSTVIIDHVAWGITGTPTTNAEGGSPAGDLSKTTGAVRKNNGCQDTNNNAADFDVITNPIPRNSASPVTSCVTVPPSLTVTGTLNDFGTVFTGSSSTSQSYSLSGANLTGAPGSITITSPSADFQVSNNNANWGATATVAYTSATLTATPVYVRFSPQSDGLKSGNVTNLGGGVTIAVNVPVTGTGVVPPTPVLTAGTLAVFGNVCLNTTAGPNSFTIAGTNLINTNVAVAALTGFTYSTTATGTYTTSLTLPQGGGSFSQQVFVKFTPTTSQSYTGNIVVSGGGATAVDVVASGAGNNNPPALTTGSATAITTTSVTLSGTITSAGCTAVTAYGIEYSLINGFSNGTVVPSTNLTGTTFTAGLSGLSPATIYYYRSFATNAGGTSYGAQRLFITATPVMTATPLTAFGSLCVGAISAANSFTLSSAGLGTSNVVVGPLEGYSFSTTATGTFSGTLNITQPGGTFSQIVFVKFSPLAVQSYGGNIPVTGGGAGAIAVPASGAGVNATPTVNTGSAADVTANNVSLSGSVTGNGCSNVSGYGFEYSGISGFANGQGTRVSSGNMASGGFSATVGGLVQNTKYYFKAYAINNGGIAYGAEQTFTTTAIPAGLIIYSNPVARGGNLHYSLKDIKPSHYAAKIFNVAGQLVYRKDMILQVNFIDDNIIIPGNIGPGLYSLEIESVDFTTRKTFMIR